MITITFKVKETIEKITASCQVKNGKVVTGEEAAIAKMIYETITEAIKSKTILDLEVSNENNIPARSPRVY